MEKEIKFRIWDKTYKKWLKKSEFGLFLRDSLHYGILEIPTETDDYIITQFTNLKDNTKWNELTKEEQNRWLNDKKKKEEWNGKDIYEGDIIKTINNKIFEIRNIVNYLEDFSLKAVTKKSKIIGNIYESPELLELLQ